MYEFHYDYMKPEYNDRLKLLFTDTDSLCYEIKTEDFYKDIADDVESRFDMSEYPEDHPAAAPAANGGLVFKVGCNKKVIGMFNYETACKQITEFVGLRAKSCVSNIDGKDAKKCKGIKKGVVKKRLTVDDYRQCVYDHNPKWLKMNVIRSRKRELYSETINKLHCVLRMISELFKMA
jgi:hypothetical protein